MHARDPPVKDLQTLVLPLLGSHFLFGHLSFICSFESQKTNSLYIPPKKRIYAFLWKKTNFCLSIYLQCSSVIQAVAKELILVCKQKFVCTCNIKTFRKAQQMSTTLRDTLAFLMSFDCFAHSVSFFNQ